jgi:undecaprenyl diphosphate synthase
MIPDKLPEHVAIIMDGNGRWAQARGMERVEGHLRGMETVRTIVEECAQLKLKQLTLFCFSSENWKRPKPELDFLMALLQQYLIQERSEIMRQNLKFRVIGRREGLSDEVIQEIDESTRLSSGNSGMTLALAINYGGRTELVDAMRSLAKQVQDGELNPEQIGEERISESLYTAGMPDPDLLIRTAGELRVSNFLLWQISYAEIWVTPICWPDFDRQLLHQAFHDYAHRERRFGGLISPIDEITA